ncbi:hypothetical protein D9619_010990 [Psilocybe cf. subviscida]|uniref:SET domain-containing protein n=1 Tax=Psilocybe cf. subviscida TaxID=2480587 RepID=A0A8H5B883_9AGAR|nr:hypothetical protein D9619_010990 [Psilocybe cf. subviscida]
MSLASDSQNSNDAQIISGTAAKLKVVVARIYAQSWADYREWSAKNADGVLASLSTRQNTPLPPLPAQSAPTQLTSTEWEITDYDTQETYFLPAEDVIISDLVLPYAPYECCTPATRNILVGDDSDHLPFIPFSDDPKYDWPFDTNEHKYVAWAEEDTSDLEVVLCGTLHRLTADLGLAHADIDATMVLPMKCGSIQKLSLKRDFPKWRNDSGKATPSALSPRETIDYFLDNFCSNVNCIQSFCNTHITVSPPNRVTPQRLQPEKPCGDSCFLLSSSARTSLSDSNDIALILSAMECSRTATPCDIAVICRLPCNQIAAYWPSTPLPPTPPPIPDKSIPKYKEAADVYVPCHANTRGHATPTLIVHVTTKRLTVIHDAAALRPVCESGKAAPVQKYLALLARPRSAHASRHALSATQRFVCHAKPGLGLFVLEPCEKDDLIAEYTGELVLYPTTISRAGIAIHRHRSYVFDINPEFSIDGARAGNETRYINHSGNPNCCTLVYLVNNEHRVGVFAAQHIDEGDELFIDYGPNFFGKDRKEAKKS